MQSPPIPYENHLKACRISHGFDTQLIVAVHAGLDLPATYDLIEFLNH